MVEEWNIIVPKPLMIHFSKVAPMPMGHQPVVIRAPSSFPYKNEKVVPWRYGVNIVQREQKFEFVKSSKAIVDNISRIAGMTRSGHFFSHLELRNEKSHEKVREEMTVQKTKTFLKGKDLQTNQGPEEKERKEIIDEEAYEFLKFIQQSKYKVVGQFNHMLARISLLELLMHSTSHRKLLMKVLSGAHVE